MVADMYAETGSHDSPGSTPDSHNNDVHPHIPPAEPEIVPGSIPGVDPDIAPGNEPEINPGQIPDDSLIPPP